MQHNPPRPLLMVAQVIGSGLCNDIRFQTQVSFDTLLLGFSKKPLKLISRETLHVKRSRWFDKSANSCLLVTLKRFLYNPQHLVDYPNDFLFCCTRSVLNT